MPQTSRPGLAVAGVVVGLTLAAGCTSSPESAATLPASANAAATDSAASAAPAPAAAPMQAAAQVSARQAGPTPGHQGDLPPLPMTAFSGIRPADVQGDVHEFAARHPEVLDYVPCFCGCENGGHQGNTDCFVAARDPKGQVVAWDPHGGT
jgi:hypothetical protein